MWVETGSPASPVQQCILGTQFRAWPEDSAGSQRRGPACCSGSGLGRTQPPEPCPLASVSPSLRPHQTTGRCSTPGAGGMITGAETRLGVTWTLRGTAWVEGGWGSCRAPNARPGQRKRNSGCPQTARPSQSCFLPSLGPQSVWPQRCHSWAFVFPVKASMRPPRGPGQHATAPRPRPAPDRPAAQASSHGTAIPQRQPRKALPHSSGPNTPEPAAWPYRAHTSISPETQPCPDPEPGATTASLTGQLADIGRPCHLFAKLLEHQNLPVKW